MAITEVERELLARYAACWMPVDDLPIERWLRENIRLDATSPIQGPYEISNSPQLLDPLRAFQDEDVRMVTTIGPNQGGRTQAMLGGVLWAIVNRPGPMQWNTSKDETAGELAEQKFWPSAKSCAAVVAKMPAHGTGLGEGRHRERKRSVIFSDGMPLKIQGCSPANLEEKSIMTQFNDECYQWPVGRLEIAHIRCNVAYAWNYKVWNGSVAGISGDDIDMLFRSGTWKEWHWKCVKCGHMQIPKWGKPGKPGGIRWDRNERTRPNGREWDYREVKRTVRYQCFGCGHEYSDTPRSRRMLNEKAQYLSLNTGAENWHQSFRFNILSVNWPGITWGQWVEEFLKAVGQYKRYGNIEPLKKFWSRRMAESWDESRHLQLTSRVVVSDYNLKDHDYKQEKWGREVIRFMSIDKQQWGYPFVIRAVAANGDSRLVGVGVGESTCLTSYEEIDIVAKEYSVQPQCVLIDSGYEAREVYAHAVKYGWTCMRGVDRVEPFKHYLEILDSVTKLIKKTAIELPYSAAQWADPFSGTEQQQLNRRFRVVAPKLARRYDWMNLHIKNLLSALKNGRALYWGVPGDVGPDYMRQINSEVRHVILNARQRRTEWWSNTDAKGEGTKRPNHAWDCECQIVVAMALQKLIDLSEWKRDEFGIDVDTFEAA
jgi:phage terminase large subunit GpA-like protein